MAKLNARALFEKFQAGETTEEEKAVIESWLLNGPSPDFDLTDEELVQDLIDIRTRIWAELPIAKTRPLWHRIAAAASILLCLSISAYLIFRNQENKKIGVVNQIHDISPGGNKAILTLANGRQISLTDAKTGLLTKQGKLSLKKSNQGELVYLPDTTNSKEVIVYNTITTPRAGKWSLTLADNSKAWLDASSSIRYPVSFTGNNRTVEITGQVYFEVVHNASKPFRVKVKNQTIDDIGTHFNVNAYDDEPFITTTLLEGAVQIHKGKEKVILKPGQQGEVQLNNDIIRVSDADTEEAIAWKNGYFMFNDENLKSVMRKISRWYDVDIEYKYEEGFSESYWGSITRYNNVSKVLKMLEVTGSVKFEIKGKKIIVIKK